MYFSWYRDGSKDLTKIQGMDINSWYRVRLMVQTWTHVIDMDSCLRHGLMLWTWTHGNGKTHGMDIDLWY